MAALGTRRHGSGRDFVAMRGHRPVIQIDLNGNQFERLLVNVDGPDQVAGAIAAAAGIGR